MPAVNNKCSITGIPSTTVGNVQDQSAMSTASYGRLVNDVLKLQ